MIVDGSYLRWPLLICPCPHDQDVLVQRLAKDIMSCRKDIEDIFGILKKRFRCLKHWTQFQSQKLIKDQFIFCCILHNVLLEQNGYLDVNYQPDEHHTGNRGDGLRVDRENLYTSGAGVGVDDGVTIADEAGWKDRINALAEHVEVSKREI